MSRRPSTDAGMVGRTLAVPRWAPLAATCLGQFMVLLDATIVNLALPEMGAELHLDAAGQQWVINVYLLMLGGLILLGGRLGDHFGRRRVYLLGGLVFSVASLAAGCAPTSGVLLVSRGIQGVGAAMLAPGTLSLLTSAYTTPRERHSALAVWGGASAGGGALGAVLGGALTAAFGWRSVFFVNVPLGVLVIALGRVALVESAGDHTARLDLPGALLITMSITTLVYAVVNAGSSSWASTRTLAALGASLVLMVAAVGVEARARNPLVPLGIVRRGTVATTLTMTGIHGGVITSIIYFQALWLQQVRGYSPLDAGLLMLPFASFPITTPIFGARLTARFGPRRVAASGLVVAIAGVLLLSRWGTTGSVVIDLVLPSLCYVAGASTAFFAGAVLLTTEVDGRYAGLGSGLFNAARQVGSSIGLAVMTSVAAAETASLLAAHHPPAQAESAGYSTALELCAGLVCLSLAVLLANTFSRRVGRGATRLQLDVSRQKSP